MIDLNYATRMWLADCFVRGLKLCAWCVAVAAICGLFLVFFAVSIAGAVMP